MNRQFMENGEHTRFFANRRAGCVQFKFSERQPATIAAQFHAACGFVVPIGYQDATGFHYGVMPALVEG